MRQKRRFIDEDSWVVDRGVTIQKLSEKRGRLDQEGGGGRRLRSQVCCDLNCVAAQIKLASAEKAKNAADTVISTAYIFKENTECMI